MKANTPIDDAPRGLNVLSAEDLLALGAETTAFVKLVTLDDGRQVYGIFSSFGQALGYAETFAAAHAAVRQNELEPVSVH